MSAFRHQANGGTSTNDDENGIAASEPTRNCPSHDRSAAAPPDQNSTSTASAHGGGIVKSMCSPPASGGILHAASAGDTTFQFFLVRYSSRIPFIITTYTKNKFLDVRSGSLTAAH